MTTKPDLTRVWASGAPGGNIEDPDVTVPGKFAAGWDAEIPPFENFNFLQQLFTQGLAHANEFGIMQWDTDTEYPLGGWARSTVDDEVYVSLTASNQGNEPSASAAQWEKFEPSIGVGQSWQDVSGSRANNVVYTNNTGRTIVAHIAMTASTSNQVITSTVGGVPLIATNATTAGNASSVVLIIPDGDTYRANMPNFSSIVTWAELR
jgi:hypothetical protein